MNSKGIRVMACTSTGIAARLLISAQAANSTFLIMDDIRPIQPSTMVLKSSRLLTVGGIQLGGELYDKHCPYMPYISLFPMPLSFLRTPHNTYAKLGQDNATTSQVLYSDHLPLMLVFHQAPQTDTVNFIIPSWRAGTQNPGDS
uniref:Uncharacterized protein n=1 Tax=Romanomermis culicivorax TaxID=13658 RepID=A0A915IPI7_ROMCU